MGFNSLLGQERPKAILQRALASGRRASYLFSGPRGVGKRTLALTFAKALNCEQGNFDSCDACPTCRRIENLVHPDVRLIFPLEPSKKDPSKKAEEERQEEIALLLKEYRLGMTAPVPEANTLIAIERIRELRSEMGFKPTSGRRRVIIILEADRMKTEAANAFLKTLEEPQAETVFILTTTRIFSLPSTIRSRCQTVPFSRLPREVIIDFLTRRFGAGQGDYPLAAAVAEGSFKSALQFMESPEEFLNPAAIDLFLNPPTTDYRRLAFLATIERSPLLPLISSLVFLYRQVLKVQLGLELSLTQYAGSIRKKAAALSDEELLRILGVLLRAMRESEYNVNKKLFLFSLLTSVA
jgi:DNA polymerase-3 subunit delta'